MRSVRPIITAKRYKQNIVNIDHTNKVVRFYPIKSKEDITNNVTHNILHNAGIEPIGI